MMAEQTKSFTWKDTVTYGIHAFSFLILGKKMDGKEFVEEIKKHYDATNPRNRQVISTLENHLEHISVRRDGHTEYSCK